ncbi:hypothetical protein [Desulfobacula sp.]|uniref:hypothetical protein n=1 Tax=Desulfobacula sp. TaxID=2593537 RepID=UPI002621B4D6|nr:hypothetical protein [Desulfobacula sp.]
MPETHTPLLPFTILLAQLILFIPPIATLHADEGITTYYIRYDVKSSKNKIIDDNLLMVPAKNDFRAEKFSHFSTAGVISAARGESKAVIEKQIRENALKTVLVNQGLKSVKTKDHDTVISYEGLIMTPLNILKNTYDEGNNQYVYDVQIEFSPIAFPDNWKTLNGYHNIKQVFDEFFQWFK